MKVWHSKARQKSFRSTSQKRSARWWIRPRLAAQEIESIPVTVFDSRQLSLGTGFLVETAARLAQAGHTLEEILTALNDQIRRSYVFAALDTLKFLRRSGRLNRVATGLGSLLQLKPIMKMHDGNPTAERVRTRKRAIQRVVDLLGEKRPLERLAIVHTHAPARVEELRQRAAHLLPAGEILAMDITPVIGAHIGPGAAGFAVVTKKRYKMNFLSAYLIIGLVILILMTVLWLLSLALKNSSIVDIFWGAGFVISAWTAFALTPEGFAGRKWLLVVLTSVWGLRLTLHILTRNWRKGEDFRYQVWRKEAGAAWWWRSFFKVFLLQGILMWIIATPLLRAQIERDTGADDLAGYPGDPGLVGGLLLRSSWRLAARAVQSEPG